MSNDPTTQRFISIDEKRYILEHRKQQINTIGRKRPSYLKILFNPTVWALMFTDFCISFGCYMIVIEGPNFIDNILNKDIVEVCLLLQYGVIISKIVISSYKKKYRDLFNL